MPVTSDCSSDIDCIESLTADFFARPTVDVARDLLGQYLIRRPIGEEAAPVAHRIVEVEAYTQDDPASHAFKGPTRRAAIMFGPPGFAYVYFIYGMYHCLNVVTEVDGVAGAVLIRGLSGPLPKVDGPGKLCRTLNIDLSHNGVPLFDRQSPLFMAPGPVVDAKAIETTARIGISKAQDRLWRFVLNEKTEDALKKQQSKGGPGFE